MTALAAGSSLSSRRSEASTTTTLTPNRAKACASSQPIAPPPSTTSERGSDATSNTVWLVRYATSDNPGIGGVAGFDPVATTKREAVSRVPSTSIWRGVRNRARPCRTSMPSPRRTGASSVEAMRAMASWTRRCASSYDVPPLAASISVFDGTQPVKVQSPPSAPSCTSRTPGVGCASSRGTEARGAAADHDEVVVHDDETPSRHRRPSKPARPVGKASGQCWVPCETRGHA